jgi:hypothetical protein
VVFLQMTKAKWLSVRHEFLKKKQTLVPACIDSAAWAAPGRRRVVQNQRRAEMKYIDEAVFCDTKIWWILPLNPIPVHPTEGANLRT